MKKLGLFAIGAAMSLAVSGAQAGPLADATADSLWGIELGGYVDVSFTYNFNDPNSQQFGNVGRIFDTDHNEFDIHGFQFYMDKLPEDIGEAGFRIDTMYGEDAQLIDFTGGFDGSVNDDLTLYQAYVSYIAPVGNGLTLDLGRFATWHGYEVIESPANANFSRSFMFGLAIPFTHTGLRATYPINDMLEISGGITQGWDVVEDNNDAKTWHAAIWWTPMETVFIGNSFAYGPEMAGNSSDYTFLYDLVATWNFMEAWTLGGNFDWGTSEDAVGGTADADWWGIAGYLQYDFTEQAYVALRGEYFNDEDNTRFGIGAFPEIEVWEITATLGYEVTDNLLTRLEYRHDDAEDDIFFDEGGFEDSQDTIAAEVVYSF